MPRSFACFALIVTTCTVPPAEQITNDERRSDCTPASERCDGVDNDCNGVIDDGFDFSTDRAHCGYCNNVCPSQTGCAAGRCVKDVCEPGFKECDGDPATYCETNVSSNTASCGDCGRTCSTQGVSELACVAGECAIVACATNRASCDGRYDTGCEQELTADPNNCGACGQTCAAWEYCHSGTCTDQPCPADSHDLDGDRSNGCEYSCVVADLNDLLDPAGTDTNCDGVDGIAAQAVFVAPDGNDRGHGTKEDPFQSLQWAMDYALAHGKTQVYLSEGDYAPTPEFHLRNGVSIFGQFSRSNDWARDPSYTTRIEYIYAQWASGLPTRQVGLYGRGLIASTVVADLAIVIYPAWPASVFPGITSISNYGVHCVNCPGLTLLRLDIDVGDGGAGRKGPIGIDGRRGADGGWGGRAPCGDPDGGYGGEGALGIHGGGHGGDGGDGRGSSGPGNDGEDGDDAPGALGGNGDDGGDGGNWSFSDVDRRQGGDGENGDAGQDGPDGAPAAPPTSAAGSVDEFWFGQVGNSGNGGEWGGGGGGGGGGGSTSRTPVDESHAGSGGGGGAGAGSPGSAGQGGYAGGASIGVMLVSSSGAKIIDSVIASGNGGNGGSGGSGGVGGSGGIGGRRGGFCDVDDPPGHGGHGGDGGRGGHGSPGSAGAGGVAYAVLTKSSTITNTGNTLSHGSGGSGGITGASADVDQR